MRERERGQSEREKETHTDTSYIHTLSKEEIDEIIFGINQSFIVCDRLSIYILSTSVVSTSLESLIAMTDYVK